MKKVLKSMISVGFAAALVCSMDTTAYAKTATTTKVVTTVKTAAATASKNAVSNAGTASRMSSGSLTGLLPWYENTGTTIPEGYTPDYTQYNLLDVAQAGDIIYEANGGYGVTGHCAIVEGKFYDEASETWYIRMIESTAPGVVRGILEDTCVNQWDVHLLRVNGATDAQKQAAVDFCISQLGDSYNCDLAHDYSADETDWYCSELVWAAYYNLGIDLETTGWLNEPGVTPRDIYRSDAVTEIAFQ